VPAVPASAVLASASGPSCHWFGGALVGHLAPV